MSYEPEIYEMQSVEKQAATKDVGSLSTVHVHVFEEISFGLDEYEDENNRVFNT